ncbi:long-chain fatty acid--CoA ligase [Pseudonocardia sp. C8]|uniref:acyl-CoA synthetase n=1 Tax=Pseudonocardia sp. C8 TaxID=2762759 RepID=UPI001642BB71|nr:long-chain fatty acid--CoA ligase [Pseudonocardia sp. C8]MBC3192992.1 long-chain fatty acid--CoA ligase [Pseudonocardia sp. C8]
MYLTQGLHRSLQTDPDAVAVVDRSVRRTFRELADRVARLAGAFGALGLDEGDRVGMLAANSVEYIEYALACAWGGYVFAPINNRWSPAEMAYQVTDAGIEVVVVDGDGVEDARALQAVSPCLRELVYCGEGEVPAGFRSYEELVGAGTPVDDVRVPGTRMVGLLYTGGTTGEPKGVMLSGGQLQTSMLGALAGAGGPNRSERFLHAAPLYHLAALGSAFQQVMLGSTHYLLPRFTPEALVEMIETERITSTTLVPTMIQRMLDHAERTGADLTSLTQLGYGASPISTAVLEKAIAMLPAVRLTQRYGMTELGPVATVLRDEDHRDPAHPERLRSAGRAALHAEVRVVDENDAELPTGAVGEIVVKGGNMMLGYWNKPDATADALRNGWMHTGDVGYFDEHGYLYVVDRLKDMIVTGGENVYSVEVENVLHQHPGIDSCAVVGVPDPAWGERVHAVLVSRPGHSPELEEVREFVAERIARYKAPRSIEMVDDLPRSPVGKILKRTIREQLRAAPAPPATAR